MNADLRLVTFMKKSGTVFIPDSISDYQCKAGNKHFPNTHYFAGVIMLETLSKGLGSSVLSLDVFSRFRPKWILKYLEYMVSEKAILVTPTDHYNQFDIGFNPERFGPLFPSYEEALKTLNLCGGSITDDKTRPNP